VTGIGAVTPLGQTADISWKNLINSRSAIKKIPESLFRTDDIVSKIAAYIPSPEEGGEYAFDPLRYLSGSSNRVMDRFMIIGVCAGVQAIQDAGIDELSEEDQLRSGVLMGSGIGGLLCIEKNGEIIAEKGAKRISPFFIPASLINLTSGHISTMYKLKGPNYSVVSACASSAHAISDAAKLIAYDEADIMVCGGSEGALCRLAMAGFASARALSTGYNESPEKSSRPWDKARDGFVMGEGGGAVVLEELEHAKRRNAKIYGEFIGSGMTGDAYHITAPTPNGEGGHRAMSIALKKAGIAQERVDYINAHGTSTPAGDIAEYIAVNELFGSNKKLVMSSTKSAIGHLLGGAGIVEAIFCLLAMRDSIAPPTLNLDDPDDMCKMNLVPHTAISHKIDIALSNSFGFGGTNISLIFKKY